MSAGAFINSLYENDEGEVSPIRIQPETLLFSLGTETNEAATGPATSRQFVKISKSNREYGLRPRKIVVKFTGAVPTGYKADQTYAIPALTPAIFAAAIPTATGTYLGEAVEVVSTRAEIER